MKKLTFILFAMAMIIGTLPNIVFADINAEDIDLEYTDYFEFMMEMEWATLGGEHTDELYDYNHYNDYSSFVPFNNNAWPNENLDLLNFSRNHTRFSFDRSLVNAFSPGRMNRFMDNINRANVTNMDLIGGQRPSIVPIQSTRILQGSSTSIRGNIIGWQLTNAHNSAAIAQAHAMNNANIDITEELLVVQGQMLVAFRPNFDPLAVGIFMTYHYFATTGDTFVTPAGRTFTGSTGFRSYIRNYALRTHGQINYNAALAQGVYSPYMMAYSLATIQNRIGWEPFRQAFRYLSTYSHIYGGASRINNFNWFITLLSDYSGQNVFNMFTTAERRIYENYFGGTMQRFERAQTWWTITEPSSNTQFLTTTNPVAQVGTFRNVYVGVSRRANASTGDAFVLSNTGWVHVGTAGFIQRFDGQEMSYIEIEPSDEMVEYLGLGRNVISIIIPNPGTGVFNQVPNLSANANLTGLIWRDLQAQVPRHGMTATSYNQARWLIGQMNHSPRAVLESASNTIVEMFESWLHTTLGDAVSNEELMRFFRLMHEMGMRLVDNSAINNRFQFNLAVLANNPIRGYIFGQNGLPQGNLAMGPTGNGRNNGCGPFSIHNALFYFHNENTVPDIAQILRQLELLAGFNLGGMLGTNPIAMQQYLASMSLNPDLIASPPVGSLDGLVRNSGASILLYHGDTLQYIHYVMIKPDGNQFLIYNVGGWDTIPTPTPSVTAWANNARYRPLILITLSPIPHIQTNSLIDGTIGLPYHQALQSFGGQATWNIVQGALPQGLSLNANTGVIVGTPTTTGTFNFTIQAASAGRIATQVFSINILNVLPVIETFALPDATVGVVFNQTLVATSNTPVTWAIESGVLPAGLNLNGNTGVISGIPTIDGGFNFTVRASNQFGNDSRVLSLVVIESPIIQTLPIVQTQNLPEALHGMFYNERVLVESDSNVRWSVSSDSLPPGLNINPFSGVISGITTVSGTFDFVVYAENSAGITAQSLSIEVVPRPRVTLSVLEPNTMFWWWWGAVILDAVEITNFHGLTVYDLLHNASVAVIATDDGTFVESINGWGSCEHSYRHGRWELHINGSVSHNILTEVVDGDVIVLWFFPEYGMEYDFDLFIE
ncbi:MAG: Ig domain-containing protein [Defluviitaleaceae bacterium]|nr:Ig domain-containing protein [Defluviitaleaceae bacterium]